MKTAEIQKRLDELTGDYIPGGGPIPIKRVYNILSIDEYFSHPLDKILDIFGLFEPPIMRCCAQISYDIQSGPIFCGEIASHFSIISNNQTVAVCPRHKKKLERIYIEPFGK
jgi:hypothetical protein